MSMRWWTAVALGLAASAGCSHCCPVPPETSAACYAGPAVGFMPPHPLTPAYTTPPGPYAAASAAPATIGTPIPQAPAPAPVTQPAPQVEQRSYAAPAEPAPDSTWHPPATSESRAPSPEPPLAPAPITLRPPQTAAPQHPAPQSPATQPAPVQAPASPPPAAAESPRAAPMPVGIPQFAVVQDGVAAGLKPFVDGGLDWLREQGYRTVLHVRAPGEDDVAERRQVEKLGLRYLSLEVSPQTLTSALVETFSRLVAETANRPLFVYDREGTLAGAMWYLHFRLTEHEPDAAARAHAARLGLREGDAGAQREMWLAVQRLLSAAR